MRALLLWLSLSAATDGGPDLKAAVASFIPSGWESGDCPASYGKNTVLCAATDSGPFRVDRHVPTLFVRAFKGACEKARDEARRDTESKGFATSSEATGRCGPSQVPCVERVYRVPGSPTTAVGFEYLLCPRGGDPLVVSYGVSDKVSASFQPFARTQVRWTPEAPH